MPDRIGHAAVHMCQHYLRSFLQTHLKCVSVFIMFSLTISPLIGKKNLSFLGNNICVIFIKQIFMPLAKYLICIFILLLFLFQRNLRIFLKFRDFQNLEEVTGEIINSAAVELEVNLNGRIFTEKLYNTQQRHTR